MPVLVGATLLTLLFVAAWYDVQERRIPHVVVLGVAALYAATAIWGWIPLDMLRHLLTGSLTLAIGSILWSRGWLGGGDVKLLAALAMWAGPERLSELMLGTAAAGGIVALLTIWWRKGGSNQVAFTIGLLGQMGPTSTAQALQRVLPAPRPEPSLPYALAILPGATFALHDAFLR